MCVGNQGHETDDSNADVTMPHVMTAWVYLSWVKQDKSCLSTTQAVLSVSCPEEVY